ncbi:MAG: hypothetical protein Q4G69_05120 [Planctomycetia bacterium]|nr:hypothetical protein [Planctomycetia bacterium]
MKSLIRRGFVFSLFGLFALIAGIANTANAQENGMISDPGFNMDAGNYTACDTGCGYAGACGTGCEYGICPFVRDVAHVALSPVYFVASLFSTGVYADCGCGPRLFRTYKDKCDMCGNWAGNMGNPACSGCALGASGMDSFEDSSVPAGAFDSMSQQAAPAPAPARAEQGKENKEVLPPKAIYNKDAAPKAPAQPGVSMQMSSSPVKVAVRAPQSVQGRQYQEKMMRQENMYTANRGPQQMRMNAQPMPMNPSQMRMNAQPMRAPNSSYYASPMYQQNINENRYQGR